MFPPAELLQLRVRSLCCNVLFVCSVMSLFALDGIETVFVVWPDSIISFSTPSAMFLCFSVFIPHSVTPLSYRYRLPVSDHAMQ